MSKRARRPLTGPPSKPSQTSRAAAVAFFALLPVAVGLGVMVGRGGSGDGGDSDALLQALRQRESTAVASTEANATAQKKVKQGPKGKHAESAAEQKSVVAHTHNGVVHDVTKFEASKQKEEQDTKLVEENPEQVGKDYITAQQNLEDVTVIGGDGSTAPAPSHGAEP
jgi:hypothetical protein